MGVVDSGMAKSGGYCHTSRRCEPNCDKQRNPPVGASLLAMAAKQATSMLNVMASSRAGSLPQGICGVGGKVMGTKKEAVAGLPVSLRFTVTNWQSAHAARPTCPKPVLLQPVWRVPSR
ncbi:hypothetical protein FQ185_20715 [Pseudomonas sp. ANT_H12B]|nr:hypothetical protein FQ185_20715 [Pseudomonas sp. ANT_H12B]